MKNGTKNDSENFGDSDDAHILLKWGVIIRCYVQYYPLQLGTKEYPSLSTGIVKVFYK